jgi:hypothetical protein
VQAVPLVVEPAFDELRKGALEGHPFADCLAWQTLHRYGDRLAGGESREDALLRYARAGLAARKWPTRTIRSESSG